MTQEAICDKHGPYSSARGSCPYCARERALPPAPRPLDDKTLLEDQAEKTFIEDEHAAETQVPAPILDDDETVVEGQEKMPLGFLIVSEGKSRGQVYPIISGTTVGRSLGVSAEKSGGAIVLEDKKVSRPHAKFTFEEDRFLVWDFGSENGTFVNGRRIWQATPVKENDQIKLGESVFVFKTLL